MLSSAGFWMRHDVVPMNSQWLFAEDTPYAGPINIPSRIEREGTHAVPLLHEELQIVNGP